MSLSQILMIPGIGQPPLQELQSLLFAGGQRGGMWLFSELSSLFQDTAGATPVTTSGQTIGRISDLSGNNNHLTQSTAASRPAYDVSGTLKRGLFDGVNDFLQTAAIDFSNSDKVTVFALVRKSSDAAAGVVAEIGQSGDSSFALQGPGSPLSKRWNWNPRGTVSTETPTTDAQYNAPSTAMLTARADISGDAASLRINGSLVNSSAADLGTGNFANTSLFVGRRGGTSFPFNGLLYGLIVVNGAIPSAAKIQRVEAILQAINVGA